MNTKLLAYVRACEANNADEAEAREGYLGLIILAEEIIANPEPGISAATVAQLRKDVARWRDYIEEELKHSDGIKEVVYVHTGILPED